MRILCFIALVAATAAMAAHAGSNTNATRRLSLTDIYSDDGYYAGKANTVTYRDNVRLIGPDMKLTCALLIADIPQSGGRLSHVVAQTNVVFDATNVVVDAKDPKGRTVRVTSQKAVYDYSVQNGVTNETITLTGDPQPQALIYLETEIATNSADVIIWNRANDSLHFQGNQHLQMPIGKPGLAPSGTNPPAATNESTAAKMQLPPEADTNFPPGSLDVVPPQRPGGPGGRGGF
jgi:hypothetical protein